MTPSYPIFLDFDGVLHPVDASHDSQRFRPETIALVNRIADYVDARIVLSTAWRMECDLEKYNRWFKNRVIGATPINPLAMGEKYPRYQEILRYLKENQYQQVPWVAVDDKASHFPSFSPALITNGRKGLTEGNAGVIMHQMRCVMYALAQARLLATDDTA
ncbi:MAG: HAD domain-containing protein [Moraxellaceae bacterium]